MVFDGGLFYVIFKVCEFSIVIVIEFGGWLGIEEENIIRSINYLCG